MEEVEKEVEEEVEKEVEEEEVEGGSEETWMVTLQFAQTFGQRSSLLLLSTSYYDSRTDLAMGVGA